jgi:hypothetical protein
VLKYLGHESEMRIYNKRLSFTRMGDKCNKSVSLISLKRETGSYGRISHLIQIRDALYSGASLIWVPLIFFFLHLVKGRRAPIMHVSLFLIYETH